MSVMKGIKLCGECRNYDYKKHRCRIGCIDDSNAQASFYGDCPLPDVVPKSEVERLNKELDELAEEHSDLIIEKDKLFDIAEKQKVEIEALMIANEKMYSASKEAQNEVENLEYENKLVFDEGEAWHRVADRYAKKLTELNVELQAMRGAANSYKAHYEKVKAEVLEEYRKKVIQKMEKYTIFGREYIQRIMREVEKEMVGKK